MTLVLKADKVVSGSPNEAAVESGQIIIGRLPSNHIVIPGERIEAIHAMVEFDESSGEARLLDMASDEGVYLNGQKLEVVKVLKAGDVIRIADVTITVREVDAKSYHESVAMASQADAIDGAGGIEEAWSPSQMQNDGFQYQAQAGAAGYQEPLDVEGSNEDAEQVAKGDSRAREFKTQQRSTKRAQDSVAVNGSSSASADRAGRRAVGGSSGGSAGSRGGDQIPAKENLFAPGKERPGGSTLEVVAFWDNAILDVKHYGGRLKPGEEPRPNDVYIGNEEDGHLIGVGPKANTKNYLLGRVDGAKAKVYLNGDMKAKVRRSNRVEKVSGPAKFEINYKEMALVKHGPLHYYLKNVSLPAPILRSFQDADGKPIIFVYAILLYALLVGGIMVMPPPADKDVYDEEVWAQVLTIRTPTPKPEVQKLPPPKPVVEVAKPVSTPPPPPPKPTPAPIVADKKPTAQEKVPVPSVPPAPPAPPKTVSLETPQKRQPPAPKPQVPQPNPNNATKGRVKDSTDKSLGPTNAARAPGDSGSKAAGTKGAFASKRQGDTATDQMGVEGGKKNIMSGINLSKLGSGIGAVSDVGGIGAIATGLKSQAGGAGAGSGSATRSSGFGGLGAGSSLNTGGVGQALEGLGGGAGGAGKGGLGDPNGRGGAAGKRIEAQAVVVPQGDPAIEGALTKEEIDAVIKQNLAQIKACYERNLQGDRGLAGRVKVAFLIKSSGRVQDASIVSSDLGNKATESCITGVIRRWKFPLPRGGGVVNVNYPFVFAPR